VGLWCGCLHKNTSFPFTRMLKSPQTNRVANTYVVCLECGREMPYSWGEMRVVKERRRALAREEYRIGLTVKAGT